MFVKCTCFSCMLVLVCTRVLTRSLHTGMLQLSCPEQAARFRSTGCSPLSPWLIASSTLIGWLFYSGERQDEEGLASHEQGSAVLFTQHPTGCTFTMLSIWMLKHRHEAERRNNRKWFWWLKGSTSAFISSHIQLAAEDVHTFGQSKNYWDHSFWDRRYSIQPQPQSCLVTI